MSYKVTEENNISIVHLDGEIDMDVTEKAKEVIMPLIEAKKEVHLNLKDVQYMDSSGISVLIESHQKATEVGTKVVLKDISKSVLKVIMMAKLEQILNLGWWMNSSVENNISEKKDFVVSSSSLKDVRSFSREVFSKVNLNQDLKDELVLAIAEAAQNIVKHAYQNQETDDKMEIKISLDNGELEIGFFDKGRPVDNSNVRHRKIDDVKPGGLGTFFIKQIMDAVVFKEGEKPWINHLILTKKINYWPIIAPTLKIGEYIAIINPPIIVPMKTIIIGSIMLDIFSTEVSNSSS